jgi:hypothetical protein
MARLVDLELAASPVLSSVLPSKLAEPPQGRDKRGKGILAGNLRLTLGALAMVSIVHPAVGGFQYPAAPDKTAMHQARILIEIVVSWMPSDGRTYRPG